MFAVHQTNAPSLQVSTENMGIGIIMCVLRGVGE